AHHWQEERRHRPQGEPERGAARLRSPRLMPAGDVERLLDATLLELCAIASPIGEERSLCDAVQARLARLPLAAPIRRYGASIVVPVTRGRGPRVALVGHP